MPGLWRAASGCDVGADEGGVQAGGVAGGERDEVAAEAGVDLDHQRAAAGQPELGVGQAVGDA